MLTLLNVIVAVTDDVVGFDITILDTTVVVADGTVYKVALDVAAAVRASTLVVVGIDLYLSYRAPMISKASSSATLPGPLRTTSVSPLIVEIVVPEVTTVVPSVGAV